MLQAGEMTISRQPDSGTLLQQRKMIDAFDKLTLPKGRTVTLRRMSKPEKSI